MQFMKGSFIDDKGNDIARRSDSPAGNKVLMTMVKSKSCPGNRRGGFYIIRYDSGIDYLADLIEVAMKCDMIQQSGAWFTIVDPDTGEIKSEKIQGMSNISTFLADEDNEEILSFVENYIESKI